jgi:hypothetical protein
MSMSTMNGGMHDGTTQPSFSAGWNSEFDRIYVLAAARIRGEYPAYLAARIRAGLESGRTPVGAQEQAFKSSGVRHEAHSAHHAVGIQRRSSGSQRHGRTSQAIATRTLRGSRQRQGERA